MSTVNKFEGLEVWKLAGELCKDVFQLTLCESFSKDFGLKDQIRNSIGSIMDDIAEGFERDGNRELRQFLSISKGSFGERRSQLYRAFDQSYLSFEHLERISQKTITLGRKVSKQIQYLKTSELKGNKFKPAKPQKQLEPKNPQEQLKP